MGDQTKSMQKLSIEHRKHNQLDIKVITSVVPQKFPTRVFSQPYRKTLTQMRLRVENNCSLHKKGDPSSSSQHFTITLQLNNLSLITKPRSSLQKLLLMMPLGLFSRNRHCGVLQNSLQKLSISLLTLILHKIGFKQALNL